MGEVENLDAAETRQRVRQMSHEGIRADVQNLKIRPHSDAFRDAAGELVVEEEDLLDAHVGQAEGNGAAQLVVGQVYHGRRRVA